MLSACVLSSTMASNWSLTKKKQQKVGKSKGKKHLFLLAFIYASKDNENESTLCI